MKTETQSELQPGLSSIEPNSRKEPNQLATEHRLKSSDRRQQDLFNQGHGD